MGPWTPLPGPLVLLGRLRVEASVCCPCQQKTHMFCLGVPAGGLRPFVSTGHCVFVTFELELKLAKCGLKACGGCKICLLYTSPSPRD